MISELIDIPSGAAFSGCRRYRYALWRRWRDDLPKVLFIGLNPSTADEEKDDPTIRRCIGFAERFGCGGLFMANLFAWRSTDPREILGMEHAAIGNPGNDEWIRKLYKEASITIAAWGSWAERHLVWRRASDISRMLPLLSCFGVTTRGHPRHPLYLKKDTTLEVYQQPPAAPAPGAKGEA